MLLKRAVYDEIKGMGSYRADIDDDALEFLADIAGGDARNALNAIELGILTTERSKEEWKDSYYVRRGSGMYSEESCSI